jgi:N-acyl-D-amino-acid deacylase
VRMPVNFGAFLGHIPLRLTVMGLEAWERAATPAEIAEMAALLDDGLASGALGLSTNFLDLDRHGRPVPSRLAEDDELEALLAVVGRYPDSFVQVVVDGGVRHANAVEAVERFARVVRKTGARLLVLSAGGQSVTRIADELAMEGQELWILAGHVAPTVVFNIDNSIIFGQHADSSVWQTL